MSSFNEVDAEDVKSNDSGGFTTGYSCSQGCSCCQLLVEAMCTGYNHQKHQVL